MTLGAILAASAAVLVIRNLPREMVPEGHEGAAGEQPTAVEAAEVTAELGLAGVPPTTAIDD